MDDAPNRRPASRNARPRRKAKPIGFNIGEQEFIQTGLTRLQLRDPYFFAVSLSGPAFLGVFLGLELAINTVFALLYMAVPGCVVNARPGVFTDAFFFSIETLATVGYGVMAPGNIYGHIVSATEIITGMGLTAIMTGLLFVRFSKPRARIVYADHAVVSSYNGKPTLMFRIGNARARLLTNATVTLHALVRQTSAEGYRQRIITEARLVRDNAPVFAIIWTLMHVIDETSPLYGFDAESIGAEDMRLFVTFNARDHALGQQVSDVHSFTGGEIRFGMRYVEAVRSGAGNQTIADYSRISAIEPEG